LRQVVAQELDSPYRLRDLAVRGDDLIALGYPAGPAIGRTLQSLLDEVVTDPSRNRRDHLLERAQELLA
jgi:tRNA nucleotidyltransferase (CCA-adding enzyme)